MTRKIELLIPVGGIPQLIAAVENGADAVYLGGTAFNARMSAENFDMEKMEKAVDFCHLRGVKVYVTINTLMRDEQLIKGLKYALNMWEIGVDALIIQDLGFGELIRENIPNMELHLSTQGTIYGEGGANAAKTLGYSRVVLAREMPLNLIEGVSKNSAIETEVFVHGALCFCFSGQCQLSRSIGGRSANHGMCAQPCRLPYRLDGDSPKYELSPKDLCLVDYVGELIKAGVSSLKVEGRLKSPEYVAIVTGIYRKYVDEFYEKGSYKVSSDDRRNLLQIFNRGSFTTGYIKEDTGDNLMSKAFPKNQGIFIGTVSRISKVRDRYVAGVILDSADLVKQLSMGDIIEARFHDSHGNLVTRSATLTYLNNKKRGEVNEIDMGDFLTPLPGDAEIYRVVSRDLNKAAAETYKNKTLVSGKYKRTTPIDMTLESEGNVVILEARSELLDKPVSQFISVDGSTASRDNLDKIRENLTKLGGTPFRGRNITIKRPIPMALKISQVNSLRRGIVSKLEVDIISKEKRKVQIHKDSIDVCSQPNSGEVLTEPTEYTNIGEKSDWRLSAGDKPEVYFYSVEDFEEEVEKQKLQIKNKKTLALLPLADILLHGISVVNLDEKVKMRGYEDWIPYISNVSMGKEDEIIGRWLEIALEIAKNKGLYVGNLQWYENFKCVGVEIYGDFGLNIYNSKTADLLDKLGFAGVMPSSETYGDENGAYPLMTAQHIIDGSKMQDRKGMKISIVRRDWSDQMILAKNGIKWDKVNVNKRVFFAK